MKIFSYLVAVICLVSAVSGATIELEPPKGILIPAPVADSLRMARAAYARHSDFSPPAQPSSASSDTVAPPASSSNSQPTAAASTSVASSESAHSSSSATSSSSPSAVSQQVPAEPSPMDSPLSSHSSARTHIDSLALPASSFSPPPIPSYLFGSSQSPSSCASYASSPALPFRQQASWSSPFNSNPSTSFTASSISNPSRPLHSNLHTTLPINSRPVAPAHATPFSAGPVQSVPQMFSATPPCFKSYLFNCQPRVTPVGCGSSDPAPVPTFPRGHDHSSCTGAYSHIVPQYAMPVVRELY